jgi:hypothetical protein
MKIKPLLKSSLPHIGALMLFFLLILIYFYPAFEGKILQQGDITNFKGMSQELVEYGKPSGWTGSMFSGMPSYHITGYSTGIDFVGWVKGYVLGAIQSDTAAPILMLLITAYILFLVLGAPWWLAALGAIAMAFSSYNIIIVVAGHVTKAWTLSFVPLVLAGMFSVFKKKYPVGFILFTFGLALLIISNHLQITYYAALLCFILFVGFIIERVRQKEYKHLGIATGILAAGALLAVLSNTNNLYLNYESGQESMRGKSELTPVSKDTKTETKASSGLDKDYVFAWSYGKGETLSLLIPNVMGGSSGGSLGKDSHLYKELKAKGAQVGQDVQTATYWGDKSFTSGPVYFGAVVCFLFLLSFFIVPKQFKWWLLGATVFFIFLAWGRNLAWFNDFMYYYFPYYNKFRTVETALVIPAFTFPILAVMALKALTEKEPDKSHLTKALYWSAGITGGICLILWIMPGTFFSFTSDYDPQYQFPDWYYSALVEDRQSLLAADAFRSLIYIVLAAALIFIYIQAKNKKKSLSYVVAGLILLVLCDLWQVDKRYLNDKNFVSKRLYSEQLFPKSVADNVILNDKDLSYRVLNLNNPFQEANTSYYHKSIGGYHAAKLGRYQDLIDRRLTQEMSGIIGRFSAPDATLESITEAFASTPTLNMLNTRYIIYSPQQPPIVNPNTFGNAWFVNSYRYVATPDEEMAALETLNPQTEAVLDKQFESSIGDLQIVPDSAATITLTAYFPNRVEYTSSSSQKGLAVFSEVYYKNGWKASIDGQPVPVSRADWILRAIVIPQGEHTITFVFDPDDVRLCGTITTIFSALLLLLVIGGLGFYTYRKWSSHD